MRILLFGKLGQIGWELHSLLPQLGNLFSYSKDQMNISNFKQLQTTILEIKPDLIINAAAYTDVDQAELNPSHAMRINAEAPGVMAETARSINAAFIHFSSDYVFDGNKNRPYLENDQPNPINIYGRSKLSGEMNVMASGAIHLILRTSWVYSLRGNYFLNKIIAQVQTGDKMRVATDQISCPTWSKDLAKMVYIIMSNTNQDLKEYMKATTGIYHVSGSGFTSRYEWSKKIISTLSPRYEIRTREIEPISTADLNLPALRPLFTALECIKLKNTFGIELPNWKSSLKLALK